jgi:hypothetical protein
MKHLIATLLLVAGASSALYSQCNPFYVIEENGEWHMETYNAKGKRTGIIKQKVLSFSANGNGYDATVHSQIENEKGKEMHSDEYKFHCKDGIIVVDMRNYIPKEQLEAFGTSELTIDGQNLEIPSSLSPGQELKDGTITVSSQGGSGIPFKLNCTISDRKVVGKEPLNTAMGNLECYKVTSINTIKNQVGIAMTFTFNVVEWIAPKYGVVKSETYNKNDKLLGYTLLTYKK